MAENRRRMLTAEQSSVIGVAPGNYVVFAAPGSGKTTVLTGHIVEQVSTGRLRPSEITTITFTKQAALDMKRRMSENPELSDRAIASLRIGTFHAEVFRLLLRCTPDIPVVLSPWEQRRWMAAAVREEGLFGDDAVRTCLQLTTVMKSAWPLVQLPPSRCTRAIARYEKWKRARRRWDFDDILVTFCARWEAGEDVWLGARQWQYLLVDEFQDTNAVQWQILNRLVQELGVPLFVVGDEDQSIYGFRGASPRWLLQFGEAVPGARRFVLSTNFRSDQLIVRHAARLIAHNRYRTDKPAGVFSRKPGVCRWSCWPEEQREAYAVAREVRRSLLAEVRGTVAVLARTRRQLLLTAEALAAGLRTEEWRRLASRVSFLILHSAKGKEWDEVHIVGAAADNPYLAGADLRDAEADQAQEEERRLFYVGMTRARHRLWIHTPLRIRGQSVEVPNFAGEAGLNPEC
ncbi:MAG: UvrD-helicase domain-containing protein [Alicyclobacillaceae bacterium]|nr:UvrD-helicase domain-containing protein [Alicyclobacillaceae bacterium]